MDQNGKKKRGLESPRVNMLVKIVRLRPTKLWNIDLYLLRGRQLGITGYLKSQVPGHKGLWYIRHNGGTNEDVIYDVSEMNEVDNLVEYQEGKMQSVRLPQ